MTIAEHHEPNVTQLLHLARDRTAIGRSSLIDAVTDLVSENEQRLSDQEQALITDIMCKLLHDVEMSVRSHLADRLAKLPAAPPELIRLLANDDIAVARPVLLHSSVLSDPELIDIIRHRGWEHQMAIAMRRSISIAVSDGLVAANNTTVITTLLENQDAEISAATMEYLVEQSHRVDSYQNPLVRRQDLPRDLAQRMHAWVSDALRQYIDANIEIDPSLLSDAMASVADDAIAELDADPQSSEPRASSRLATRLPSGDIDPKVLVKLLREGEISLFESMLSRMTGLDLRLIQRLVYPQGGEGLAVACRAADIPIPIFASIFLLSRQARPGDHSVEKDELRIVLRVYDKLPMGKARHILRNWRKDPVYETLKQGLREQNALAAMH
ncbi:MAG: DUF2336 domain-containing protein [Alphaproteobacteria bacterium]